MLRCLEEKTGDKWYICLRVHPQLAPTFKGYQDREIADRIIDESQADDMYEILAGMDAYITDYSSAIFEAGFAGIPSFIYADDIEKYTHDRGSLMWNLATDQKEKVGNNKDVLPDMDLTLPFSIFRDNDELVNNIMSFDRNKYLQTMEDFKEKIGLVFDGKASKRVTEKVDIILYK